MNHAPSPRANDPRAKKAGGVGAIPLSRPPCLRKVALAAGFLLLLLEPSAPGAKGPDDVKDWIEGPIRYVARKEEMKAFRAAESDTARTLYIERFWRRRDPTPDTLVNEYRQLFWERVQQANTNFVDSTKPGWKTDRGKVFILYGPPNEVQEDLHLQAGGSSTAGHGVIRWLYEGRPGERMDLDPLVVVAFERDVGGEYRISYEPKLNSPFFDANAIREDLNSDVDRFLDMMSAQSTSRLSVMLDLGRMQEVPPQEQVLLERVETSEAYQTHEIRSRIDRYYHPDAGGVLVALTVDLNDTDPVAMPAIVARFAPLDATRRPRLLGEGSFKTEQRDGARVAQGRVVLDPGEYTLTVLVADPVKVRTGLFRATVQVPEPSARFRFSDVAWASTLESLRYASLASHDEPFHVGPFRVVPRFEAPFRRGEVLKLFFEVYGATLPVEVSYQLQGQEDDGSWVDLGRPQISEQDATAHGWELPSRATWPLGEYRVVLEVRDRDGRMISREVPFTLDEPLDEPLTEPDDAGGP